MYDWPWFACNVMECRNCLLLSCIYPFLSLCSCCVAVIGSAPLRTANLLWRLHSHGLLTTILNHSKWSWIKSVLVLNVILWNYWSKLHEFKDKILLIGPEMGGCEQCCQWGHWEVIHCYLKLFLHCYLQSIDPISIANRKLKRIETN